MCISLCIQRVLSYSALIARFPSFIPTLGVVCVIFSANDYALKCGIQSFAIRLWSLASVSKSSSQIGYQVHDFSEFSVPRYSESRIITKLPPEVLPDPLRCELRVYLSPARTALSPLPLIDAASLVTSLAL